MHTTTWQLSVVPYNMSEIKTYVKHGNADQNVKVTSSIPYLAEDHSIFIQNLVIHDLRQTLGDANTLCLTDGYTTTQSST